MKTRQFFERSLILATCFWGLIVLAFMISPFRDPPDWRRPRGDDDDLPGGPQPAGRRPVPVMEPEILASMKAKTDALG